MKKREGFTLIEMLIVMGIIAVLVGVMMVSFSGSSDSARAAQCLNNMRSLANAVTAYGMETRDYPPAGTYQYRAITKKGELSTPWRQGWIGYNRGNSPASPYYSGDNDTAQHYAITNGAIWRYIRGGRNAYTCPSHILAARKEGKLTPAWSYVMNSYFGWKSTGISSHSEERIREFDQNLTFYYTGGKESSRSPSKTLLFAELPFVEQSGLQTAQFSTSASDAFDTVLQYDANGESGLNAKLSCAANGAAESIGFNHRNGKKGDYMAHVAFADGHVEKIPLRGGSSDIKKLTTILCVGHGYLLTGRSYEKAE